PDRDEGRGRRRGGHLLPGRRSVAAAAGNRSRSAGYGPGRGGGETVDRAAGRGSVCAARRRDAGPIGRGGRRGHAGHTGELAGRTLNRERGSEATDRSEPPWGMIVLVPRLCIRRPYYVWPGGFC